jgi:hypothetical protein
LFLILFKSKSNFLSKKEYWIVSPTDETAMVFLLDPQGQYGRPAVYSKEDTIQVGILDELSIPLKDIFKK